jgi:hypothetical protein
MNIYVAHSTNFEYRENLYLPIRKSALNNKHNIILPHETSNEGFDSKEFITEECDLVVGEVSYPSTGLGIELGIANMAEIPIICVYKKNAKISSSLKNITDKFLEYNNNAELISGIEKIINTFKKKI